MLWCQGAQKIALFNRILKPALNCTVWSQRTPIPDRQTHKQTDGQTDEHHGNSATIPSMNASRA